MRAISPRTSVQLLASLGIALVMTAFIVTFCESSFIEITTLPGAIVYGVVAAVVPWWMLRRQLKFGWAKLAYAVVMAATGVVVVGVRAATDVRTWEGSPFPLSVLTILSLFGALFGGLTSVFICVPVGKALLLCERPSRDGPALMMRFVAVYLLGHGLFLCLLVGRPRLTPHAGVAGYAMIALAVLFFAVSTVRAVQWSRWRSRILAHRDPGWFAVPISSIAMNLGDVPALTSGDRDADGVVLGRSPGPPSGAYRTGENFEPYALVKLPEGWTPERAEDLATEALERGEAEE